MLKLEMLETKELDDIEALAQWQDRQLFVICSQSRKRSSSLRDPSRECLALVHIPEKTKSKQELGTYVYDGLRKHLIHHLDKWLKNGEFLTPESLDAISRKKPSGGGLNVEGMVEWDRMLLLGLREPTTKSGDQIVVPLRNPEALVNGKEVEPDFGPPLILNTETSGLSYHIVRWKPPSAEELKEYEKGCERSEYSPKVCDIEEWRVRDFPGSEVTKFQDEAMPEGIASLGDDDQDRFTIVQDPEAYKLDDKFWTLVSLESLLGSSKAEVNVTEK